MTIDTSRVPLARTCQRLKAMRGITRNLQLDETCRVESKVAHSFQSLEVGGSSVPHDPHGSPAAGGGPRSMAWIWTPKISASVDIEPVVMVSHPALGHHHQQGGWRVGSAPDGDTSFAEGKLLRRDPDSEITGRTLREGLEKIDATE
jgi:hypothetical protein